jgi:hypothetical protein
MASHIIQQLFSHCQQLPSILILCWTDYQCLPLFQAVLANSSLVPMASYCMPWFDKLHVIPVVLLEVSGWAACITYYQLLQHL